MTMDSLKNSLKQVLNDIPTQDMAAMKMRRAAIVQTRVKEAIERVYKESAPYMLSHINATYILKDKDTQQKELVIYTDDSLARADLDARQEFIRMALLDQGEDIGKMRFPSSGIKMRKYHPFVEKDDDFLNNPQYIVYFEQIQHALTEDQESAVEQLQAQIDDPRISQSFSKAMRANLKSHQ